MFLWTVQAVGESHRGPQGWDLRHAGHIEEHLDTLDPSLLPVAAVLLAFCAS